MHLDIHITESALTALNLTAKEALTLLMHCTDAKEDADSTLFEKGLLTKDVDSYLLSYMGADTAKILLTISEKDNLKRSYVGLASTLMSIVPQGRMEGTCYWYKCNTQEIIRALTAFRLTYGVYSDRLIIQATREYVEAFNGDYTYMKLLRKFIYNIGHNGEVSSELASYIENILDRENDKTGEK